METQQQKAKPEHPEHPEHPVDSVEQNRFFEFNVDENKTGFYLPDGTHFQFEKDGGW